MTAAPTPLCYPSTHPIRGRYADLEASSGDQRTSEGSRPSRGAVLLTAPGAATGADANATDGAAAGGMAADNSGTARPANTVVYFGWKPFQTTPKYPYSAIGLLERLNSNGQVFGHW